MTDQALAYCPGCATSKPVSAFGATRARRSGIAFRCRDCANAYARKWRKRIRETKRDEVNASKRTWYRSNPRSVLNTVLKTKYGITIDQYEELLAAQGDVCVICRKPERVKKHGKLARLSVDHCHETGAIRGLLCDRCNRGVGLLGDENLGSASEYLRPYVGVNKANHVEVPVPPATPER